MFRLLFRNLLYHRRGNFAVLLGVVLGTAVLTGALLVGDSLRGSLRALALDQLGWVDQALVAGRFFRQALADEIGAKQAAAGVLLQGSAAGESAETLRAGKVTVLGVDERFWPASDIPVDEAFWQSDRAEAVINESLARTLNVREGARVALNVQRAGNIPRETIFSKRNADAVLAALRVTIRLILPDEGMARFTLKPTPEPVRNAFVPLRYLQSKLELGGKANALLVGDSPVDSDKSLRAQLTLEDWNLKLRTPEERARAFVKLINPHHTEQEPVARARWRGRVHDQLAAQADARGYLTTEQVIAYYQKHRAYLSLESNQMYLSPAVAKAANAVCRGKEWTAEPSLVYLADAITDGKSEIPYAVVAGVEPSDWPRRTRSPSAKPLRDNEIALVLWPGMPFQPKADAAITLTYYAPDAQNHLERRQQTFTCVEPVPLTGDLDDPDLTPEFQGITDKLDMLRWDDPPFPYDRRRVTKADEDFWKRYRTTPRAYVTLDTAQRLWGSRFGDLTSMRIRPSASAERFRALLLEKLQPEQGGFVFQKVKEAALRSGAGSTDFGEYFLYFSFFLIVSALLLVGLLFRLNLDRRAGEMGVLLATGWSHARVRLLLLGEGTALAVLGSLIGILVAPLYAKLLLRYLQARWPGGASLNFLHFHAEPLSLAIGYVASLAVSVLTILWATGALAKLTPRALLAGQTTSDTVSAQLKSRWAKWILIGALVGAGGCVAAGLYLEGHEAQAGSFVLSGTSLLVAGLTGLWLWLKRSGAQSTPQPTLTLLGVRNAGRHRVRSVLTAGLLAAATFLVVAVESFHKEPAADFYKHDGGSGGFPLLAESDVPLFEDLNQPRVRAELNLTLPEEVKIFACRVRAGDDASCLNLYQPLRPRILGVPHALIERGGFAFGSCLWSTPERPEEKKNPWLLLERPTGDGTIPVFADATSATHILKVGLGGIIKVQNERGEDVKLKLVGLLSESIFQSELVMADSDFLKLFPRQEGFSFFLIDGPREKDKAIQSALETALADQGFFVSTAAERVEAYLAVENTYLATFQALGGLGLLLGAAGLAIVLLRGVWERRGELALLRALGFRRGALAWLVLAENLFLLLAGLGVGTVAAAVAVEPHASASSLVWLRLALLLGLVIIVGLAAGLVAVVGTLRTPVLTALRRE
jgi:ABC-type lipoprotein release transport system permease subunit